LRALYQLLATRFWINPYGEGRAAEYKPYQLKIAQQTNLSVPRTLITNEPAAALQFFDTCGGNVIYKTFTAYHRETGDGSYRGIYTTRVRREDLQARSKTIALAPCLFQEYVPKESELRITVIGDRVFAAEIDSQKSPRMRDDWRRYDHDQSLYRPTKLPREVEKKVQELMRKLGLVFGCIDMILTPEGRYVFLEINPSGQWYWVELLTGMPLLDYFTAMLIAGKRDCEGPVCPNLGSELGTLSY